MVKTWIYLEGRANRYPDQLEVQFESKKGVKSEPQDGRQVCGEDQVPLGSW